MLREDVDRRSRLPTGRNVARQEEVLNPLLMATRTCAAPPPSSDKTTRTYSEASLISTGFSPLAPDGLMNCLKSDVIEHKACPLAHSVKLHHFHRVDTRHMIAPFAVRRVSRPRPLPASDTSSSPTTTCPARGRPHAYAVLNPNKTRRLLPNTRSRGRRRRFKLASRSFLEKFRSSSPSHSFLPPDRPAIGTMPT